MKLFKRFDLCHWKLKKEVKKSKNKKKKNRSQAFLKTMKIEAEFIYMIQQ